MYILYIYGLFHTSVVQLPCCRLFFWGNYQYNYIYILYMSYFSSRWIILHGYIADVPMVHIMAVWCSGPKLNRCCFTLRIGLIVLLHYLVVHIMMILFWVCPRVAMHCF